jgi:hypothetical protein
MLHRKILYKIIAITVLFSSIVYSMYFAGIQINRAQTERTDLFNGLQEIVNSDDVVLSFIDSAFTTPIKYYFNHPLYWLRGGETELNKDIVNAFNSYIGSHYTNIYILTDSNHNEHSLRGHELMGVYDFSYSRFSDTIDFPPFLRHDVERERWLAVEVESRREFLLPTVYKERFISRSMRLYRVTGEYNPILNISHHVFPAEIGETVFTSGRLNHYTENDNMLIRDEDGYMRSIADGANHLVFGPYQDATKGTYTIEVFLELPESEGDADVAVFRVTADAGQIILAVHTVRDTGIFMMDLELDEDYSRVELCLITYVPGVVFMGYEVTRTG